MTLAATLAAARAGTDPQAFLEALPYARFLGAKAVVVEGRVRLHLPWRAALVGNPHLPAIHGGVLASLIELTAAIELLWRQDTPRLPKPVTTTVDYRRSAGPHDCHAEGEVTRQGRRLATVTVTVWQDQRDKPVAAGQAHFLLGS